MTKDFAVGEIDCNCVYVVFMFICTFMQRGEQNTLTFVVFVD
jgi:hypothetical protein